MSNDNMNLANIKMKEGQSTKENKVENKVELHKINEGSGGTIFEILNLPELDKGGNKA